MISFQQLSEWLALIHDSKGVQVLVVMASTFLMAKLISFLFRAVLKRIVSKTATNLDDVILGEAERPVYASLVLLGGYLSLRIVFAEVDLPASASSWFLTIGIYYWTVFLWQLITILLEAASRSSTKFVAIQPATYPLFNNIFKLVLIGAVVFALIKAWGVDATGWLASAGIVGIAVGFASKDTLSNLFAGVFIMADRPYRVGDYVQLDTGERGKVSLIGLRSTRIITRDDIEVTVPNAIIGGGKIVNETGGPHEKMRVRIPIGIAYGTDINNVERLLLEVVEGQEGNEICTYPSPRVRFRGFGSSSLDFELLCWIQEPEYRGLVKHRLLSDIYHAFRQNKVEIPFSKQDLYIKELPEMPFKEQ